MPEEEAPITLMTLVDPSGDGRNAIEAVCDVLREKINQAQQRIATESLRGAANQALISALSFMVTEYQTLQDELHTIEYVSRVETSGYARVAGTEDFNATLTVSIPHGPFVGFAAEDFEKYIGGYGSRSDAAPQIAYAPPLPGFGPVSQIGD